MYKKINTFLVIVLFLSVSDVHAHIFDPGKSSATNQTSVEEKSTSAGCLPPSTSAELNVNNVRALIHSGGDMWWDLIANPRYEIPKGSGRHSLYVGNLWIAGREAQTQTLKVAAQRYRTGGVDFWTGPLDKLGTASIDAETCDLYDQMWMISRQEVEKFKLCGCGTSTDPACDGYTIPQSILKWPGNPMPQSNGQHLIMENMLAPFYDADSNGIYDPTNCEYPLYDLDGTMDCNKNRSALLYGDFTLWWVFNDKGNIHGESQTTAIGLEVRAQAFGFSTNDEINNMTFYNYQIINRGTTTLQQCYFGVNTDADIGGAKDDYTGCDVERGFGYMYNADNIDETMGGELGYGENPPAIGIDFFLGPYLDSNGVADFWDKGWNSGLNTPQFARDAITALSDSSTQSIAFGINGVGFEDSIVDNERYGMRRFVYYNNGDDPSDGPGYYNLLRGYWTPQIGGGRMVYGGTGKPIGAFINATHADFMFPGNTDPLHWGTKGVPTSFNWSELNADGSNVPTPANDRRFVQSAGPFTLKPGAVNDITTGVVWARATSGASYESVLKVLAADIKAQSLFEHCFKVLNGPTAPDLTIQELDQELLIYLTNKPVSNNYLNQYEEENYFIPEYGLSTVSHDTLVWVPQFDSTNVSGTAYYLYQAPQPHPYDSLFVLYIGMTPVDSLFGYLTNQSAQISTSVQTGELDTNYNDRMIRFEGYLIYQVKNKTVTATDIFGPDGSEFGRLVAQCDLKNYDAQGNPIAKLVNFEYNDALGYSVPAVKVDGANQGIKHSFKITQDEFTNTSSKTLVNHKEYHYMALAYGYNNFKTYNPDDPTALDGQKEPFFPGRLNIKVYTGIPHIPTPENGGTVLNALYGFGPPITRIEGRGNGGNILDLTKETEDAILASPEHRSKNITYENGLGPVKIKVIDPLSIQGKKYLLKVLDTSETNIKTIRGKATWVLLDPTVLPGEDDTVAVSETDLSQPYEQIIYDRRNNTFLGFSIDLHQVEKCGPTWTYSNGLLNSSYVEPGSVEINGTEVSTPGNGLLYTKIDFEDPENFYLGFFQDLDGNTPLNWVRQGSTDDSNTPDWNSNYWNETNLKVFFDPQGKFVTGTSFYGGGGLVPYILTSSVQQYEVSPGSGAYIPGHNIAHSVAVSNYKNTTNNTIGEIYTNTTSLNIGSVDIVITPDKSKWSRCPVFETGNWTTGSNNNLNIDPGFPVSAHPKNLDLRFSFSVDKDGNKNYASSISTDPDDANFMAPFGMGWFPGYAIDVETGERLNIAFGEDSYLPAENGRDMLFNPSPSDPTTGNNNGYISPLGDYLLGGKHYIYIFQSSATLPTPFPNYDEGLHLMKLMCDSNTANLIPYSGVNNARASRIWRNCIWAGMPFHVAGKNWLGGEARIRLRVQKPYQKDYSAAKTESIPINDNNPLYEFSFEGMQTILHQPTSATSALDIIEIVPNPYYAASEYETSALDNKVKIVNLPDDCDISIYTLNGTLIRKFIKRSNTSTSVDWDLKNFKNIPISTGLYIIHINAPGIGEKILKWYGVMRALALDNF
jgi:hypothetical protein